MAIKKDMLDERLAGADGKDVFGKNGLFSELKKALAEHMLNAEMDHHLTHQAAEPGCHFANHRNGYLKKKVLTDAVKIEIAVPRLCLTGNLLPEGLGEDPHEADPGALRLTTMRSHDEYNTTFYAVPPRF
jgi:transposase-like protein